MKIIFICGSLEPGRDGVGDYTRKLACQLIRCGHNVVAVSLNDNYIKENIQCIQKLDGIELSVLRLSSSISLKIQFKILQDSIKSFAPHYISLQYVPYSFHKNGIPLYLGAFLRKLNNLGRWHIMIHEPFLSHQKTLKGKLVRLSQMISLFLIKKNLKPLVVHTSIPFFRQSLKKINFESNILGLFGNISVSHDHCQSNGKNLNKKNKLSGIFFGSVPEVRLHSFFANKMREFCENSGYGLHIIICGKTGRYGKSFFDKIKKECKELPCEISFLGQLEENEISNLFLNADFGISRNSLQFLGKSGTAISMLEHGLPLWAPLLTDRNISEHLNFRPELCFSVLSDIIYSEKKNFINRLPDIANQFLQDLKL